MSDHIEHDGKKYFAEEYLILANNTAERRGERIAELEAENSRLTQQVTELAVNLGKEHTEVVRLTQERDEAYLRSVRIAAERAFIEQGRESRYWRGAYQIARDIAALNGIDFDSLDFNGSEQKKIRELYWPDQQEAAELTRAHTEPQEERERWDIGRELPADGDLLRRER